MKKNTSPLAAVANPSDDELVLDEAGLEAAKNSLSDGAITPAYGPHRDAIVKLLNKWQTKGSGFTRTGLRLTYYITLSL